MQLTNEALAVLWLGAGAVALWMLLPAVLNALKTSDIGFNLDLGKIAGIESSAKVKLTPSGHIGFTFGVDLTPGGSQPITTTNIASIPTA